MYCALYIVDWIEDDVLWIKVYEYGIWKKIVPRDYIKEKYKQLTEYKKSENRENE